MMVTGNTGQELSSELCSATIQEKGKKRWGGKGTMNSPPETYGQISAKSTSSINL